MLCLIERIFRPSHCGLSLFSGHNRYISSNLNTIFCLCCHIVVSCVLCVSFSLFSFYQSMPGYIQQPLSEQTYECMKSYFVLTNKEYKSINLTRKSSIVYPTLLSIICSVSTANGPVIRLWYIRVHVYRISEQQKHKWVSPEPSLLPYTKHECW